MSSSRREFLAGLTAAGAIAAVPRMMRAEARPGLLYPPADLSVFDKPVARGASEIHIGYAAITWNGKDTQAIEEIAALGYPGIQLRANVLDEYPDPHALRDLLAKHKLTFVALSSGGVPLDPSQRESTIALHAKHAQYLQTAGGKYLQLVGASVKDRTITEDDYEYEGRLLTDVAKRVADYGIQTGFHNHMSTTGEHPDAVDSILAAADAQYVKLELDIAHYVQGGGDPAAAIRKYAQRLLFLHLKDVKNSDTTSGYEFVELGQGRVDVPATFEALRSIHFRGWGVIELDGEHKGSTRTPKESAEMSKLYLEQKVGVRL